MVSEPLTPRHAPRPYLIFIEGMRGLAAFYIVLGHIGSLVDPSGLTHRQSRAPVWLQTVLGPLQYGHLAVAAFIVISGYCLELAASERRGKTEEGQRNASDGYLAFIARRCRRILPAYYGCLALSLVVALTVTPIPHAMPFTQYLPVTWTNVAAHLLLIQNLLPAWMYKINGVLWSIAIEFQLYFLFPFLSRELVSRPRAMVVFLAGGLALGIAVFIPHGLKLYPWFLPLFVLGMSGVRRDPLTKRARRAMGASVILGLLAVRSTLTASFDIYVADVLFGVVVVLILLLGTDAVHTKRSDWTAGFGWKPFAVVGAFSYSLYLMHHPIFQVLAVFRPGWASGPVREFAYLLGFGIPIVLWVSYRFGLIFEGQWVNRALRSLASEPASAE